MDTTAVRLASNRSGHLPYELQIGLTLTDPELIRELLQHDEGSSRDEYTLNALKIGLLALKQARGQIDGETIRREGDLLLGTLQGKLETHTTRLNDQLTGVLKEYFDPQSGRFQERVQALLRKDGELEEVLRRQIGTQDSELCKTLAAHVGQTSPLMKVLNPKESEGLLKSLRDALIEALADQRTRVLAEFTLDQPDSALSRLVKKLTDNHGDLSKNLQEKIDEVVREFSLDAEDSALSRLVASVTVAQKTISDEFSLDNDQSALSKMTRQLKSTSDAIDNQLTLDKEDSALSRLKNELFNLLKEQSKTNQQFQSEVKMAIEAMKLRKAMAQRTTEHGRDFEQVAFEYIQQLGQPAGDTVEFVGDHTGFTKNSRKGDITIRLHSDHFAADAVIAIEAKADRSYSLTKARDELQLAKTNRGAGIGIFIFARDTAPAGQEPFLRHGEDLYIIWEPDDTASDLYINAAIMVAKALCTRQARQRESFNHDFAAIDKAIIEIERQIENLAKIKGYTDTINNQTKAILKRVELDSESIAQQVETLRENIAELKSTCSTTAVTVEST